MSRYLICLPLVLASCIEYEPAGQPLIVGVPNAYELDAEDHTESFVEAPPPKVDVLWLIDNSCSMQDEQDGIALNFPTFIDYLVESDLDYHIGVISTDMTDETQQGRLQVRQGFRFVDSDTPDPALVAAEMIALGLNGSGDEKGRGPIWHSMETHGDADNAGFFRDGVPLHIVAVSDEPDQSVDITEEEFISYMLALQEEKPVTLSTIVGDSTECFTGTGPGLAYLRYTEAIGGIQWSICDDDWTAVLDALGELASDTGLEYFLGSLPDVASIEVLLQEASGETTPVDERDWIYDQTRNSVIVSGVELEPDQSIVIKYESL